MDTGKQPRTHDKKSGGGSVHVGRTDRVETSGPVGSGGRPSGGAPSGGRRPSGSRRAAQRGGMVSAPVLLLLIAYFLLRGGSGGSGQQSYPQQPAYTAPPVVTAAPVTVTQAPTAAPAVVSGSVRDRFYTPKSGDSVTVMVYMCGTDLESNYGMATSDLQEMANAKIGSNVNVIVETGGCKLWKNKIVSNATNQIYKVESGGVRAVNDNMGAKAMVKTETLTEFIRFCTKNYPADRNILIFWDHGGGSISGYGYDELYKSSGSMDLAEIEKALKDGGARFDWIGFDACLMATLETGMVCADYADYLLASEESEPGTGWYYTNWLTSLSRNTAMDTVALGRQIVDDFVSTSTAASHSSQVSLSLMDLAQLQAVVPAPLRSFSEAANALIQNGQYAAISNARANARQFARSSRINQIDLIDFADRIGTPEAAALASAVRSCVKYNNTNIPHAYGVSVYFPYESMGSVKTAVNTFNSVGMDAEYTKCIKSFASLVSGGQITAAGSTYGGQSGGYGLDLTGLLSSYLGSAASGGSYGTSSSSAYGSISPIGSLLGGYTGASGHASAGASIDPAAVVQLLSALSGRSMPAELDWMDTDLVARSAEYIAENTVDPADIVLTLREEGGKTLRVLTLTPEQWDLIQAVELNIYVDDGEGFIDLGLDNTDFSFDGDSLVMDYAGEWMCLNGQPVAFYMDSADETATRGHIPALLNGELVNLQVIFDDANPTGTVTGAQPMYADVSVLAKGDMELAAGDRLEFIADYYRYDGSFEGTYRLTSALTVGRNDPLELTYEHLDEAVSVTYRLTDIYNNHYWTPAWQE